MIEVIGALFRWLQLASNMILIGGCVFLAIAGHATTARNTPWLTRLNRTLPWLSVILLLGLVGLLATTTAQATGVAENAWRLEAWLDLLQKTRIGLIWKLRASLALLVFGVALYVRFFSSRARWQYVLYATVAALTLAAGSLASHSAADELSVISVLPYALHTILASVWFGGLPAFLTVLFTTTHARTYDETDQSSIQTLKQFSKMALPVMIAVVATGIIVTDRMVDTSYASLFATSWGWLLNTKLALLCVILVIAARARLVWLPALDQHAEVAKVSGQKLRKWVTLEVLLAAALVVAATLLSNAVPGKHTIIEDWPYPFRFSIDATWGGLGMMIGSGIGVALLILAVGAVVLGRFKRWEMKWRIAIPAILTVCALVAALPPLATQAFPETYRKTPVPFDAISVANGAAIFASNCVLCHGPQAKGNGVLAKTFAIPPVDLLTEPHTAKHTAGDFFHWLTHGIPGTGMPAFADKLSEEDRWDVVNFLHATSRGYQARLINPYVAPNQAYMAPQNFSYSSHDGTSGTLKDFRRQKAVLLIIFSLPESRARLEELQSAYPALRDSNTMVLAVPANDHDLRAITAHIPFPVVTQGAPEITRSYALFRRTLSNPDLAGEGTIPKHMEFLIDRYGYLRARWIPAVDGSGWADIAELLRQIEQLNREKELRPPPDDHVH
jgi:putative copper resistance protein D